MAEKKKKQSKKYVPAEMRTVPGVTCPKGFCKKDYCPAKFCANLFCPGQFSDKYA